MQSQGPVYVQAASRGAPTRTTASRVTLARQSAPASPAASSAPLSVAVAAQGLTYHSQVEQAVVNARQPLALPASGGLVKAGPFAGHHLNRHEEAAFKGPRALSAYAINEDPTPQVIRKPTAPVKYTQQVTDITLQNDLLK
jgi:hypothetical protein